MALPLCGGCPGAEDRATDGPFQFWSVGVLGRPESGKNCAVLEPSKPGMVRRRAGIWDAAFIPLTQGCHRAWYVVF